MVRLMQLLLPLPSHDTHVSSNVLAGLRPCLLGSKRNCNLGSSRLVACFCLFVACLLLDRLLLWAPLLSPFLALPSCPSCPCAFSPLSAAGGDGQTRLGSLGSIGSLGLGLAFWLSGGRMSRLYSYGVLRTAIVLSEASYLVDGVRGVSSGVSLSCVLSTPSKSGESTVAGRQLRTAGCCFTCGPEDQKTRRPDFGAFDPTQDTSKNRAGAYMCLLELRHGPFAGRAGERRG